MGWKMIFPQFFESERSVISDLKTLSKQGFSVKFFKLAMTYRSIGCISGVELGGKYFT